MNDLITQDLKENILRITLNNPLSQNTLSLDTINNLKKIIINADTNKKVKVIIIGATGKVFCAGHNLKEINYGQAIRLSTAFRAEHPIRTSIDEYPWVSCHIAQPHTHKHPVPFPESVCLRQSDKFAVVFRRQRFGCGSEGPVRPCV